MDIEDLLHQFLGSWSGTMDTYLEPGKLASGGNATAYLRYRVDRAVVEMEYNHHMSDEEQTGLILFTLKDPIQSTWFDTYHTSGEMMILEPTIENDKLVFRGSYGDPDNPWGWRIELYNDDGDLYFTHYNITPEDEEYVSVKGIFSETDEENSFLSDFEY